MYNTKVKSHYTALVHSIKLSGDKIGITFDKDPLASEQNNYLSKFVNVYIVYELEAWQRSSTGNFKFENCLFGATNVVKNSDKEKYEYGGYIIAFDSVSLWCFDNGFTRNVIIFGADNSSSFHSDNRKNNFLILGEGPTYSINGSFGSSEKKV